MKKVLLIAVLAGVCGFSAQAWYHPYCYRYYRHCRYYAPRFAYLYAPLVYPAYPAYYPAAYPVVYPVPYYPGYYY